MPVFRLEPHRHAGGTYNIGHVKLVPKQLVEQFGQPEQFDEYKVSGQYRFVDDEGHVYTLYDWKCTSLYNDRIDEGIESEFPPPNEFWAGQRPVEFHIGGTTECDIGAFKVWLRYRVG